MQRDRGWSIGAATVHAGHGPDIERRRFLMSVTTIHSQAASAARSLSNQAAGVCPKAPAGMHSFANTIEGNVKWGVLILLFVAFLIGIGAVLSGRIFHTLSAS
jgi:hypothetical protein